MIIIVFEFVIVSNNFKPTTSTLTVGTVSPVPAERVTQLCPDCPMYYREDNDEVKKTLTLSLEKFNKDSGLSKHFALLKFQRALVSVSSQF